MKTKTYSKSAPVVQVDDLTFIAQPVPFSELVTLNYNQGKPSDQFDTLPSFTRHCYYAPKEDGTPYVVTATGDVDDQVFIELPGRPFVYESDSGARHHFECSSTIPIYDGYQPLKVEHYNIPEYPDPVGNVSILEGTISPCPLCLLIPTMNDDSEEPCNPCACSCGGDTTSGGAPVVTRSAGNTASSSSSGGSAVTADATHLRMRWSCLFGAMRGMDAVPAGHIELYARQWDNDILTPAGLAFRHPIATYASLPTGGAQVNQLIRIYDGASYKNFLCDGLGLKAFSVGASRKLSDKVDFTTTFTAAANAAVALASATYIRYAQAGGSVTFYSVTTGRFEAYLTPLGSLLTAADAANYTSLVRDNDGVLRQIWNLWDGLADIEEQESGGYTISLYTPAQVGAYDSGTGLYPATGSPFKVFTVTGDTAAQTISIAERDTALAGQVDDYVTSWTKTSNSWNMTKGTGAAAITESRVRNELEDGTYEVITTLSKGGTTASCVREVYQANEHGNLRLSHTEAHGSAQPLTTTYTYDTEGRVVLVTSPDGGERRYAYDINGRLRDTSTPWAGGDCRITSTSYVDGAAAYINDVASVTETLVLESGAVYVMRTDNYTYSEADNIKRVECRSTAAGATGTRLTVRETYTGGETNIYARGRVRMTQAVNGVQTWHEYAATTEHGALYTETVETRVDGVAVNGQSTRSISYINAEGNTVRSEEWILLSNGTWTNITGVTNSYDSQNRLVGTLKDNGRSTSRVLTCKGQLLREIDEDGVQTDHAYDSARQLTETTRAAVMDGETTITPETITEFVRDAAGRVTSTTTRAGAMETTQSTAYDLAGRVVSRTDILGRTTATAYSADGLTTIETTPTGATLITISNTDGSVAEQAGSGQQHLRHRYDLSGSNRRETVLLVQGEGDAETETTLSQSTTNGFGEQTMASEASTTGFIYTRSEYNTLGQLTKTYQDTGWNTTPTAATLYEYGSMGQQVKRTLALAETPTAQNSPIVETAYGAEVMEGNVYSVTTSTRYNAAGAALTSTQKQLISHLSSTLASKAISVNERNLTSSTWTEYNTGTKRTSYSTIPTTSNTAVSVSVDGFVLSSSDHAGISSSQTRQFTATGMRLTHTDGRGNTTTTLTDKAGRTTSVTDAAGNTTTSAYEATSDNPTTITNAQGKTTCYRYDHRGRKVAEWGTAVQPAAFAYDDADRLTALTTYRAGTEIISVDPTGRTDGDTTIWTYHAATGLELTKTYADGKGTTTTYDAFNRLASETDGRGITKTHSYEHARGLLLGTAYSDGTTARSYQYNHLGQPTQVVDDAGTRSFGYNSYGEMETNTLLAGGKVHIITELRDSLGRSNGYTYARDGATEQSVSYGYGADGRLSSAAFTHGGESKTFTYGYLAGTHLLHTLAMPNGMTLTQQYEPQRNLLTGMVYTRGDTGVVERSYTYDSLGRPLARNTSRQGTTQNDTFHHSNRNELTSADVAGVHYGYDYDNIGNRRMMVEGQDYAMYEANQLNQYSSINGAEAGEQYNFTPTFDDAGNQTTVKTETGIWTVTYNAENRPITFTRSNTDGTSTRITCTYDYQGRRAEKKVESIAADGTATTTLHQRYLYRGYLQIAACDLTLAAHPRLWGITWDPTQSTATRPLAIQKDGMWYTYGWDLTKNICELFSTDGTILTTYSYTPYGSVTAEGIAEQPLQWSSEYHDSGLGLVYYNYRHYNAREGKWVGRDMIISRDFNLYNFSAPMHSFDSLGLLIRHTSHYQEMRERWSLPRGYRPSTPLYWVPGGEMDNSVNEQQPPLTLTPYPTLPQDDIPGVVPIRKKNAEVVYLSLTASDNLGSQNTQWAAQYDSANAAWKNTLSYAVHRATSSGSQLSLTLTSPKLGSCPGIFGGISLLIINGGNFSIQNISVSLKQQIDVVSLGLSLQYVPFGDSLNTRVEAAYGKNKAYALTGLSDWDLHSIGGGVEFAILETDYMQASLFAEGNCVYKDGEWDVSPKAGILFTSHDGSSKVQLNHQYVNSEHRLYFGVEGIIVF